MSTNHFNALTEQEAERLAILLEECSEVIQVCGKILRHGYNSTHPDGGPNNRELLEKELGHLHCAYHFMQSYKDIEGGKVHSSFKSKRETISKYLRHHKSVVNIDYHKEIDNDN